MFRVTDVIIVTIIVPIVSIIIFIVIIAIIAKAIAIAAVVVVVVIIVIISEVIVVSVVVIAAVVVICFLVLRGSSGRGILLYKSLPLLATLFVARPSVGSFAAVAVVVRAVVVRIISPFESRRKTLIRSQCFYLHALSDLQGVFLGSWAIGSTTLKYPSPSSHYRPHLYLRAGRDVVICQTFIPLQEEALVYGTANLTSNP